MILKNRLRVFTLVSFIISAAVLVLHSRYFNMIGDDAYITFQYACNWAVGNGLVFNPGEQVEGYTNFGWGEWETVLFPVDVEPLSGIAISIGEPGRMKNAGLTYRVSIESMSALVCQRK